MTEQQDNLGYLLVSTRTADGVLLIPGAVVRVYDSDGTLLEEQITNRDGYTNEIALSAPPLANSLTPNQANPYRVVTITVNKEGFYPMTYTNAPIFPNIVTIQQTNLQPIPVGVSAPRDTESTVDDSMGGAL